MSVRQSPMMHPALLTLRVALGLIFLYYGAGKLFYSDYELSLEQESTLVSLNVIEARPGGPQPPAPMDATDGARATPTLSLIRVQDQGDAEDAIEETEDAMDDAIDEAQEAIDDATDASSSPREVRRLYALVFPMNAAAQDGHWPDVLSQGVWLERMAWIAATSEFVAGFFLLLGVFTRLWALVVMGTMLAACWLTQVSPHLGTQEALLGFLPPWRMDDHEAWIGAYQTLFFQLIIFASAMAVLLAGPGAVSVDRIIFGSGAKKKKVLIKGDA